MQVLLGVLWPRKYHGRFNLSFTKMKQLLGFLGPVGGLPSRTVLATGPPLASGPISKVIHDALSDYLKSIVSISFNDYLTFQ